MIFYFYYNSWKAWNVDFYKRKNNIPPRQKKYEYGRCCDFLTSVWRVTSIFFFIIVGFTGLLYDLNCFFQSQWFSYYGFFFYRVYRRLSIFLRMPRVVVIAVTLFMYNSVHRNDINTIIFYKNTSTAVGVIVKMAFMKKKNYIRCIYYEKLYNFIILTRMTVALENLICRKMTRPSFCTDENPYCVYLCKICPK